MRSRTRHDPFALVALGGVLALLLGACADDSLAGKDAVAVGGTFQFHSPGGQKTITYPESERAQIADITGPSVIDDTEIRLSNYAGHIVVINAWGQWCGPCRTEVDDLQTVHEYLTKEGGTVLGINIRDNKQLAKDFMLDNGLSYPSIFDPPFKTAGLLGGIPASVVPTTIILDKQHRPAVVFLRAITEKELMEAIAPLESE
ncbi:MULTISPECIES: TlpA disulfide reductase family protein [unclassified Corynebacterium]|uniref:TlpA family protein disulfide reductase n=1 Tax=unclassified Corynebacterium TaxID=2624378 RepID=UPI002169FFBB|nr:MULTISPECIES: TlpA disulfide reductase family protein [unclassified Corynebacterium]MCS4491281.1 TlpA family protein disulfide reductase [Corynebacterium sp. ES2715-CONJ3]MCS4531622.1 TlpA family protein disulfide reductase [Corynebacterium sp. ES2730-CONJ]